MKIVKISKYIAMLRNDCTIKLLIFIITIFFTTPVLAQEVIKYEIYEKSTGNLIGNGVKKYSSNDIIFNPYVSRGRSVVEKFIELEQGYKIGARIFFESKLTGFGLVAELKEGDFSWEWYNQKNGDIFQKLQGKRGLVKVRVSGLPLQEILEEVEFLNNATLSFCLGGAEKPESHDIIIKKGSVLKFD